MKKWTWAVALGVILLIAAAFMFTSYNNVYAAPVNTQGPANTDQASSPPAWERTGNFTKGDVIMVELLPNIFWAQNPSAFDVVEVNASANINVFYVDINITDPANSMSHYEVWLTYDSQANEFAVYNASADSFGHAINSTVFLPNGFNFTYTFIAGTADLTGTYYANVTDAGFALDYRQNGTYLPSAFELFYERATFQITRPYLDFLYVGYALIPVSVALLAYGFNGIRRKRRISDRNLRHPNSARIEKIACLACALAAN